MKTKFIANSMVKFLSILALFLMLFALSCSDKYEHLRRIDAAPILVLSKDSMTIRIKDYSNYFQGAGFLKINVQDTLSPGVYINCIDTTGHLEVLQDSAKINGKYIAINQPAIVFIACKDTGYYPLTVQVFDRFQNSRQRTIMVRVVNDEPPITNLKIQLTESLPGMATYIIDASGSTSKMGRIIMYNYTIGGANSSLFKSSIKVTLYSGTHRIAVTVADDLGILSPICESKIIVP